VPAESSSPTLNRSVSRSCAILQAFTSSEPQLTLAELAQRVALPRPTTYRLAATLIAAGFMNQLDDGRYELGFRIVELGAIVRANLDVVRTCSGVLEQIAQATGETVILGEADWRRREVTIVHRIDSAHSLSVLSPVGRRSSIPPGALGKALLLGLQPDAAAEVIEKLDFSPQTTKTHTDRAALRQEIAELRLRGYAIEEDEYLPDVSGVAVPVLFEDARPLAAVGVVGPSTRLRGDLDRIGELVRDLASPLGRAGGGP
jgi:DNA-binding IclR family transcriptional regulator